MAKKLGGCLKIIGAAVVLLFAFALIFGGSSSGSKSSSDSKKEEAEQVEAAQTSDQEADAGEAEAEPEPEPEPEPVEYLTVDANTLFDTLDNNPLNAKNTYEGTPVRVTGVLKNIDASGKYFNIGNGDEWSFDDIQCYIRDDDTLNRIASASMGDTLTVCGTISSVGEILGYSMDVDYIE